MSEALQVTDSRTTEKSLMKGLLAGLIAGAVATAAKSLAERIYPPRTHGEPEPPDVLVEKIAGRELSGSAKALAAGSIHWGFGVATGAAYGALAEYFPAATDKDGASFGLALAALTHENALPALGLSADAVDQTPREHTSEMASHLVFGVVTETVRRFVRKHL
jgi:putative membrane protein